MRDIDQITADDFDLSNFGRGDDGFRNIAVLSLRRGLRAYFGTVDAAGPIVHLLTAKDYQPAFAANHSLRYIDAYCDTIVGLHNFFEVAVKEILFRQFPQGQTPVELALGDLRKALIMVLPRLISSGGLPAQYQFLDRYVATMVGNDAKQSGGLNGLRNRVLHRGVHTLVYYALDELVAGLLLVPIREVLTLTEYASLERFWKYPKLACGIDPLTVLEAEGPGGNTWRLAVFKELGRAAYIFSERYPYFADQPKLRSELEGYSQQLGSELEATARKNCPVCGLRSLLLLVEPAPEVIKSGATDGYWQLRTTKEAMFRGMFPVFCSTCDFKLNVTVHSMVRSEADLSPWWT